MIKGGSSGGSAVAVSSGMCYGAFGTDTGGSIRQPASYCGVVGLKPSYGRISRWGLIAFASSLDTPSIIARTVDDVALLLECVAGFDKRDSTSSKIDVGNYSKSNNNFDIKNNSFTIGVPQEYNLEELPKEHRKIWKDSIYKMEKFGAKISLVNLSSTH